MATNRHIDKICFIAFSFALLITFLFFHAKEAGVQAVSAPIGYGYAKMRWPFVRFRSPRTQGQLYMGSCVFCEDDWDSFLENCTDEKYVDCTVVIDGEICRNVAIRAKGNTSLSSVANCRKDSSTASTARYNPQSLPFTVM